MKLIGFTGSMGSGKSTAIECVKELQAKQVKLVKFAQPLYDIQEYIYNRVKEVYGKPKDFVKDRKLLQMLGTDWGRNTISNTIWTDLWLAEVNKHMDLDTVIVCDDVRFDNEAKLIKQLGGTLIKMESIWAKKRTENLQGITGHQSESGVDLKYVDYVLENNSTVDELRLSLLAINSKAELW